MPSDPGIPTLDQLRVFFGRGRRWQLRERCAAAWARDIGISYSIGNLEAQLGISFF
jgi:hypothetical protein